MLSKLISRPLSTRMRPTTLEEYVGQEAVVGKGTLLRKAIEKNELPSLIFWGPPGVGKTTLAEIIAKISGAEFVSLSGVESGKDDLRKAIAFAETNKVYGKKTVLFIDEIHRWNKAQQDALLPYVERGVVTLIGATTENPSFEIISALLSRSRVVVLQSLTVENIILLIDRAVTDTDRGLGKLAITFEPGAKELLADLAGGDARVALNGLELAVKGKGKKEKEEVNVTIADIKEALQKTYLIFDKRGEEFYNLISALHKSMRGSDANASLYWLARMLEAGCDPLYVARRVLRFASEDIGMANSEAMIQANAAYDACHKIGYPECTVHLAQAVVYCAKSKKSNVLYTAYLKAAADAKATSHLGVPLHLRNAPTKLMKDLNYGKNYKYPPDFATAKPLRAGNPDFEGPVDQEYLPEELKGKNYF